MPQEFKHFDKVYRHLMGSGLKNVLATKKLPYTTPMLITAWPHMDRFTQEYGPSTSRYAVYEAKGAEEWQKFRVSLKGLNAREKLYCLMWYWDAHISPGLADASFDQYQLIRINNYLGALKRGGFLDDNLHIIKE